jgi:hypothetical protein
MTEYKKPLTRGLDFKVLDDILHQRYIAVTQNPKLKEIDRWDLSDCFYNTRKQLDAMGYDVTKLKDKRGDIHGHVKAWCDRRNLKRHQIGIFAADRAVMAFAGQLYSISFENYKDLAYVGVDIVLVEKEGTVVKLVPFTTELGIAFVQSEGFVSEYGQMLADEVHKEGNNIAMLTDFDASGIVLAHKIKGVIRIGINLGVLDEFNAQKDQKGKPFKKLDPLKLMESANGSDHWTYLKYLTMGKIRDKRTNNYAYVTITKHHQDYINLLETEYEFSNGTTISYLDFLRDKRIELNTVMNEVGSQRFWNWLKDKLLKTFPTRNYNRFITTSNYVLTETMARFELKLEQQLTEKLRNKVDKIKDEYRNTKNGFIVGTKSKDYTEYYLGHQLDQDEKIQEIDSYLEYIIDKLDDLNSENT